MQEQVGKVDIKTLPFEQRADMFQRLMQSIGIEVGQEEEHTLRDLGKQIVKLHSLPEGDEKDQLKKEIRNVYDALAQSKNPQVGEAVHNIVMSEATFF
ncbi:hypothetical protein HYU92_03785 [Candidatus Curtissbacteria bacterium]|nr:hypothetical protein [Candidatus Curtissbacteria bacterium]